MSFERSSALESQVSSFLTPLSQSIDLQQPTTFRRQDDPEYRDDPEFSRFSESLSEQLFELTSKIGRLSQQINLLGTKRDTERVRERVHDLLDETREDFKKAGQDVKKLGTWDDLSVRDVTSIFTQLLIVRVGRSKIHATKAVARVSSFRHRVSINTAPSLREAASFNHSH